jgi:hypothetical protein
MKVRITIDGSVEVPDVTSFVDLQSDVDWGFLAAADIAGKLDDATITMDVIDDG